MLLLPSGSDNETADATTVRKTKKTSYLRKVSLCSNPGLATYYWRFSREALR